jgi:bla regulator protein blaR1
MLAWMVYVVVVTLALSLAALIAEHAARQRSAPSRWIWVTAILASLMVPTIIASVSIQIPSVFAPAVSQKLIVLREATSVHLPAVINRVDFVAHADSSHRLDQFLSRIWGAVSAVIVMGLALHAILLYRRRREWLRGHVGGASVYIAPDIGPAVVGLLRPHIVVPAWIVQAPIAQQQLVIAHEQSHLDANDPQVLTIALCLLVIMPWNLPLWWQLHRLRRAIEVDCDARVLRGGRDVAAYGETLIEVGQHLSSFIGAAAAMSESKSFLEQRIKIMLTKPGKWARASATGLIGLSIAMSAIAMQVSPPDDAQSMAVALDPVTLAGYAGPYQFGESSVMTVALHGTQLTAQLSGQGAVDFFPKSDTEFFAKVVNAQISFVHDAQGRTTALVLHQNGQEITAPRVNDSVGEQINAALAARVSAQTPFPGSEAALRLLLSDPVDSAGMSAALVKVRKQQQKARQAYLAKLGPVSTFEFLGVDNQGRDKYLVRHEHGTEEVRFILDSNGVMVDSIRYM